MVSLGFDRLVTNFQPVFDIESGMVVAHEALSRAFSDGVPVPPDRLLHEAYQRGTVAELDTLFIESALRAAEAQGLVSPHSVFVNVEPASLADGRIPAVLLDAPPLVIEITERALTADPGSFLTATAALRAAGHLIAIDDLGAEAASLALLPLFAPEIVKLDMNLIRRQPDRTAAMMMTAIAAYAERTSSIVLAEGIEAAEHITRARVLGASLAQGWHFGRPSETAYISPGVSIRRASHGRHSAASTEPWSPQITPFDVVASSAPAKVGDRAMLLQVSMLLEERAAAGADSAVLLATFQAQDNINATARRRYEGLLESGCLLTVFSTGTSAALPHPARSVVIADTDPLASEWDVVLLTADYAAALTAREIDRTQQGEGLYEFVLTTNRHLVTLCARALLSR
jgi:EAL domain-containing protein (putative c-di-GMP-specific phosphodiesterase class I)